MDLNIEDIKQLRHLYSESFTNDSPEFIDFFFSQYIIDADILRYYEGKELISAGYIIKKPALLFGKESVFPFATALATKSSHRGKDKIRNIINSIYNNLLEQGHYFFGLHPFNFHFYKKFSFGDICYCAHKSIKGGISFESRAAKEDDFETILKIYNTHTERFDNKLVLTKEILTKRINEYRADGIEWFLLSDKGKDFSFVFCAENKIDHFATINQALFEKAENFKNCTYYDYSIPQYPFLQGRIIDARKALENYCFDIGLKKLINIKVYDPDIKTNNFSCSLDICEGKAELKKVCSGAGEEAVFDIKTLTERMFTGDGQLFKKQLNFFSDKF